MPHPHGLQSAIRRNPRSTGPNRLPHLPNLAKPQIVTVVQPKPQQKRRPIRREAPYWAIGRKRAMDWLEQNGFPEPGDGGQAALERCVVGASEPRYPLQPPAPRVQWPCCLSGEVRPAERIPALEALARAARSSPLQYFAAARSSPLFSPGRIQQHRRHALLFTLREAILWSA